MKKLIIPEGFGEDADKNVKAPNVNTAGNSGSTVASANATNQINATLRTGGLPQSKPLTKAQQDAQAEITPDVGILDPRNSAETAILIKYPWLLYLLISGGGIFGTVLARAGYKSLRSRIKSGKSLDREMSDVVNKLIFNNDARMQRWKKSKRFRKDMQYLADALLEKGLITKLDHSAVTKEILDGNLRKFDFRNENNIRKEFKKFAVACLRGNKISYRNFLRFSKFSESEANALVQATEAFRLKTGIKSSADDLTMQNWLNKRLNSPKPPAKKPRKPRFRR